MKNVTFEDKSRAVCLDDIGHRFRGAFFDKCSHIERWAYGILAADSKLNGSTYLFGQKLGAVRALADPGAANGGRSPLKNPQRVAELLDRFQPYAEMRAALGHAEQSIAFSADGEPLFVYRNVGKRPKCLAITLTAGNQQRILDEVTRLARALDDQRLRRVVSPPAPPPPTPAAAACP